MTDRTSTKSRLFDGISTVRLELVRETVLLAPLVDMSAVLFLMFNPWMSMGMTQLRFPDVNPTVHFTGVSTVSDGGISAKTSNIDIPE